MAIIPDTLNWTSDNLKVLYDILVNVENGADWLDTHVPSWWNKIDVSELNMGDVRQCICGQLFVNSNLLRAVAEIDGVEPHLDRWDGSAAASGYDRISATYDDDTNFTEDHGFNIGDYFQYKNFYGEKCDDEGATWEYLASCWIDLIKERKG